jgi:uncharacterized protein YjbI with pentapeptide repeats
LRETLSLRGRRLERAALIDSSLRKADLTAARLQGAVLRGADLREAKLSCERGEKVFKPNCAQLQGADLRSANLQGADLYRVNLQGADLQVVNLQGADLRGAYLQGADLRANLQGADLSGAHLRGAILRGANLQGADLRGAYLQGADLRGANLQGADLDWAQLQGANLQDAELQGANLTNAYVWLASFPGLEPPVLGVATMKMSPLTPREKAELTEWLQNDITDGELLKKVLDTLNPILRTDPQKWEYQKDWSDSIKQTHQPAPDEIAGVLAHIACEEPEGHIALVMAERAERAINGALTYGAFLVKALLNDTCEGAKALTKEKRAMLEKLGAE